jgi:hypothetical protein
MALWLTNGYETTLYIDNVENVFILNHRTTCYIFNKWEDLIERFDTLQIKRMFPFQFK